MHHALPFANNTCLALYNQINDRSPPFIKNSGSHMKIENITALAERVCMSRNNMRNPSCNGKNKLEIY
jgi:hypothetical protein